MPKIMQGTFDLLQDYVYEELMPKKFINIKHNTTYVIMDIIINSTNENDGQIMIVYSNHTTDNKKMVFCKEYKEFFIKFKQESFDEKTFLPNHSEAIGKIIGE